jgi:hypothetical protein
MIQRILQFMGVDEQMAGPLRSHAVPGALAFSCAMLLPQKQSRRKMHPLAIRMRTVVPGRARRLHRCCEKVHGPPHVLDQRLAHRLHLKLPSASGPRADHNASAVRSRCLEILATGTGPAASGSAGHCCPHWGAGATNQEHKKTRSAIVNPTDNRSVNKK